MTARVLTAAVPLAACAGDPTSDRGALREVGVPLTIVGIGVRLDFRMPFDGHACRRPKRPEQGVAAIVHFVGGDGEYPSSQADLVEVASSYPVRAFLGVASLGPLPYCVPDVAVHVREGFLSNDVAVVHGPAGYHRIKGVDQPMLRR